MNAPQHILDKIEELKKAGLLDDPAFMQSVVQAVQNYQPLPQDDLSETRRAPGNNMNPLGQEYPVSQPLDLAANPVPTERVSSNLPKAV